MENGLPQNTVQALAQTTDGFLWIGTEIGLVRFDGNTFVTYDQNSKPALPGSDVQCLLAVADGSSLQSGSTSREFGLMSAAKFAAFGVGAVNS